MLIVLGIVLVLLCGGLYYWKYMKAEKFQEAKEAADKDNEPTFVLYYASWCHWSKVIIEKQGDADLSIWDEVKSLPALAGVKFIKYKCDTGDGPQSEDQKKCNAAGGTDGKYAVAGYPTMRFYKGGLGENGTGNLDNFVEYPLERTVDKISEWLSAELAGTTTKPP